LDSGSVPFIILRVAFRLSGKFFLAGGRTAVLCVTRCLETPESKLQ